MYAVYNYKAGSTQAQVLADLIAILTGTTNVASLSASCVQGNTSILATEAAGWSVFDAAAGANQQVLRALNQDGTTYKYLSITATSTTAFTFAMYESWNASTHVGTNLAGASTTNTWDATNGGYFYFYATSKNIIWMPWTVGGGYLDCKGSVMEFSRDTVPAGYPCAVIITAPSGMNQAANGISGYIPRLKAPTAAGDLLGSGSNCSIGIGHIAPVAGGCSGASGIYRDASENIYLNTYAFGVSGWPGLSTYWPLGVTYDVRASSGSGSYSALDEIVYGGLNYVAFKTTGGTIFVPKK